MALIRKGPAVYATMKEKRKRRTGETKRPHETPKGNPYFTRKKASGVPIIDLLQKPQEGGGEIR